MKLHLPLSLRAALVSVVAALSAAPSHAAVTPLTIPGYDESQGYATVGTSNGTTNSVYVELPTAQTWNTAWSVVFSANGGSSFADTLTLLGLDVQNGDSTGIVEGAKMSGGDLILTTWSNPANTQSTVDFSKYTNVTFVMSRASGGKFSLTVYDSANFASGSLCTLSDETHQTFGSFSLKGLVFGALGDKLKYNDSNNNVAFDTDTAVGSYQLTKVGFSYDGVASISDLANYYYGSKHKNLTWEGGGSGYWSSASWNDGTEGSLTFSSFDSAMFATENVTVTLTGQTIVNALAVEANTTIALGSHNLNAVTLAISTGKELSLSGTGTVDVASLSGGEVHVDGSSLTVSDTLSDTTLTVDNGGTATVNSISGTTATVADDGTLTLAGAALGNTTVNGTLTLEGNQRITLSGKVTLGSVVNNMTGTDAYAFTGNGSSITLKITGTADLTNGGTNTHSKIGVRSGTIEVAEGGSLTTARIWNSDGTADNAHVNVVGNLAITGNEQNIFVSLTNSGTITTASGNARGNIKVHSNVNNTGSLTVGTLEILNTGGSSSTLGGTVNATRLQLDGGTATVSGAVTANQIAGASATAKGVFNVADGGTLTLTGSALGNTTVNGTLTMKGNRRVNLTGGVTLKTVANDLSNLPSNEYNYAFVGESGVTLTITGETDLTKKSDKVTTSNYSDIGFNQGKLVIAEGAELTMGKFIYSTNTLANNTKLEVAGSITTTREAENYLNSLKTLDTGTFNSGREGARADLYVHNQVENAGTLKAATLRIASTDNAATNLGGTVDVTSLQLDKGTAYISGEVTAGKVADSGADKTGVYSADPQTSTGTLTIKGDADASTGSTLSGNFTVVKQGASTQNFNGSGNERFTGSLKAEGGTLNLANMDSGTRSLQSIHVENGATLGLYRGAVNGTVVTVAAGSLASGTGGGTLNANVVMNNASELVLGSTLTLGGSLTLDGSLLSGALFKSLYQGVTSITLFTGVTSLTIGNPTSAIATLAAGETFSPVTFDGFRDFTDAELAAAFRNNFDPDVFHMSYTADDGGSIIMTANVPEPTTATLSLLALAGLCARRRRK